jgi:hypothetical protein
MSADAPRNGRRGVLARLRSVLREPREPLASVGDYFYVFYLIPASVLLFGLYTGYRFMASDGGVPRRALGFVLFALALVGTLTAVGFMARPVDRSLPSLDDPDPSDDG